MQALPQRTAEPPCGPVAASLPLSSAAAFASLLQSDVSRSRQHSRRLEGFSGAEPQHRRRDTVVYPHELAQLPGSSAAGPPPMDDSPHKPPFSAHTTPVPCGGTAADGAAAAAARTTATSQSTGGLAPTPSHRTPSTWHTLTQEVRDATAYEASRRHAAALLDDFEAYQRSVGGALPTRSGLPTPPTSSASAGCSTATAAALPRRDRRGSGGEVRSRPQLDVEALQQDRPRSPAAASLLVGGGGGGGGGPAAPPLASVTRVYAAAPASPLPAAPVDPAVLAESKRRAMQMLCYNAQARAGVVRQGMQLWRDVYVEMLKGDPAPMDVCAAPAELPSPPPRSLAAPTDATRTTSPRGATAAASRGKIAGETAAASAAAAAAEAERALTLLYAVRAMRRQTEDLTVSLLHACGAWGCWTPSDRQTRSKAAPLFADLFVAVPPLPSTRTGSRAGDALDCGAAHANTDRAEAAGAAAAFMADELVSRRSRACAALRAALAEQQTRWPAPAQGSAPPSPPPPPATAPPHHPSPADASCPARDGASWSSAAAVPPAAAIAFLELAAAPPQRAVPPPPPTAVQLDLFASQQGALRRTITRWHAPHTSVAHQPRRQTEEEAGAAPAAQSILSHGGSSAAPMPYAGVQAELHHLRAQRQELQQAYDKLERVADAPAPTFSPPPSPSAAAIRTPSTAAAGAVRNPQPSAWRVVEVAALMDNLAETSVPASASASLSPSRPPAAASRADPSSLNHTSDTPSSSPLQPAIDSTRPWVDPPVGTTAVGVVSAVGPRSHSPLHRGAAAAADRKQSADASQPACRQPAAAGDARGRGVEAPSGPSSTSASAAVASGLPRAGAPTSAATQPPPSLPQSSTPRKLPASQCVATREVTAAHGSASLPLMPRAVHRALSTSLASDLLTSSAAPLCGSDASGSSSCSNSADNADADAVQESSTRERRADHAHVGPDACAASWQPVTNAALSTHPAARAAAAPPPRALERCNPSTRLRRERRAAAVADEVSVLDPAVQQQLLQWVLERQRQQRQLGTAGVSPTSSSSAGVAASRAACISAADLEVAADWLRVTAQAAAQASRDAHVDPPAAVLRVVALIFPGASVSVSLLVSPTSDALAGDDADAHDAQDVVGGTAAEDAVSELAATPPSAPLQPPSSASPADNAPAPFDAGAAAAPESVRSRRRRRRAPRSSASVVEATPPPAPTHPRLTAPPAVAPTTAAQQQAPAASTSKLAGGGAGESQARRRGSFFRRLFTCGG